MKTINVMLCNFVPELVEQGDFIKWLQDEINSTGKFNVAKIDVCSMAKVNENIMGNKYDVLICNENGGVNASQIGAGTIGSWIKTNSAIKIILVISAEKKGKEKLSNLFDKGFYNAIYDMDTGGEVIASILEKGRTADEAREYYGLAESFKKPKKKTSDGAVSEKEDVDGFAKGVNFEEIKRQAAKIVYDSELEDGDFAESDGAGREDGFGDFDFSGLGESFGEMLEGENEEALGVAKATSLEEEKPKNVVAVKEEPVKEEIKSQVPIIGGSLTKSVEGKVIAIYDENAMLCEFESLSFIEEGKQVDDYKFVFVFIEKGKFVNGRYQKGSVSFTGYGGCVVSDNSAVIEVPCENLISLKKQILGKGNPVVVSLQ